MNTFIKQFEVKTDGLASEIKKDSLENTTLLNLHLSDESLLMHVSSHFKFMPDIS